MAVLILTGAAGIVAVWQARLSGPSWSPPSGPVAGYLERLFEHRAKTPARLVYPYSVIPGGVASPEEVIEAARRDPVVARHYAGFDPRRARTITLNKPRLAYVSYRIKDRIFFTKKPVRLFEGEQVITDGKTTIRARCGNKVEEAPQMAVSAEEPPEEVLNTPKLEPEPERATPAVAAPGLEAPKPEEETPLAAVVPPSGFKPLDMPVSGPGGIWLTPPPPPAGFAPPVSAPGPGAVIPAPPPAGPAPDPGVPAPPPSTTPPGAPPVTPPPANPPGTTPPATPPGVPPSTPPGTPPPVAPPPATPPGTTPPTVPPGTTPPSTPPGSPPVTPPPGTPPTGTPPGTPPTGGDVPPPGPLPPPGGDVPPPGPLPPPLLPPPPTDPETPGALPPPEVIVPPPSGEPPGEIPEPEPIPEPSTYAMIGAGLAALAALRLRLRRGQR
ncbi:MAG: hypothetical protein WHT08_04455 [Bryobacteraceae bacterium]